MRRPPPTPRTLHSVFSVALGGLVPRCLYRHELVPLALALIIWAGSQIFIHIRGGRARGVFLDQERELFTFFGVVCFLGGLLVVSTYYVVHS
jgi:hypothetical protein